MAEINGVGRVGIRSYVAPVSLSSIVTSGLILNLDAGNAASYPGTGTTWTDLSGNGNNGTLTNGTSYSSANGGTLTFDGINDYVDTNIIPNQSAFTYCIWGKSSTLGYPNRIMGNADALTGISGASIMWGTPAITGQAEDYNRLWCIRRNANNMTNDIITPSISGFTNNWHYIVATYDNVNGSKLYCDNVLVGSKANVGFASSLKLRIGKDGNGTDAFNGSVGAVQVYNKALNATEIATNFNATKSRFGFVNYTTRTAAFATATGITDTTILNALNTFDAGLISNGLDTDLEVLYPFVGGTSTSHQYNFINPSTFPLTFNGGWIHSSTGAKPNGTNAYAQTGWVPSSRYSNGLTNGAWGTYIRQSLTAWPQFALGSFTPGGYFGLAGNNTTSQYWRVNGEANTTPTTTSNKGMFQASRALTSTNMFVSQNSQQFELSGIFGNGGIPSVEVYLSSNNNGGAIQFGSQEQALTYLSKGKYTQAQQSTFYTLVQAFQTALNRQV